MEEVQQFKLCEDFWIARWLKKPSSKELNDSQKIIKNRNLQIEIGISKHIIKKVLNNYNMRKKHCNVFGKQCTDIDVICSDLELSKPIVELIIKNNCNGEKIE